MGRVPGLLVECSSNFAEILQTLRAKPPRSLARGAVLSLIGLVRRIHVSVPRWTELVPPYAIGHVAMFWFIQRTLSFFS